MSSPNTNGAVIARVENNEVYILEDYNDKYCKVKSGEIIGYMAKFYFSKENLYTKESSTSKYSQNTSKNESKIIQKVYTSSPILNSPNADATVIFRVESNEVYILEDYNDKYCKVKSGRIIGYMSKFYFKSN